MESDRTHTLTDEGRVKVQVTSLSPAGLRTLDRLRSGSAFWVRDRWRFRGGRGGARATTIDILLAMGLVQLLTREGYSEVRLTPGGRSALANERLGQR